MKSPEEVAEGAVDRLCSYDAINDDLEGFFEETAANVAEFQSHFIFLVAKRLSEAASNELNKESIKKIDDALEVLKNSGYGVK
jgi:hypothetical protein